MIALAHLLAVVTKPRGSSDPHVVPKFIDVAPLGGRKVPEHNDEQVREIPAYSWCILYHLREGQVSVVTLVQKRPPPRTRADPAHGAKHQVRSQVLL